MWYKSMFGFICLGLLVSMISGPLCSWAWSKESSAIDVERYRNRPKEEVVNNIPSHIEKNIKITPEEYIDKLVEVLTADYPDPFIRVKNIHDWICDNIAYDAEGYFAGDISNMTYTEVLKSGKTVCSGYARLFTRMTQLAGFKSGNIVGSAKGYDYDPFKPAPEFSPDHAWNWLEIQGKLYIFDCTWDAGRLKDGRFVKNYSTAYLFPKPEHMIYTHFPVQKKWQLLDDPFSYDRYAQLPPLSPGFFAYLDFDEDTELKGVDEVWSIALNKKKQAFINVKLQTNSVPPQTISNRAFVDNRKNRADIHLSFPGKGKYRLRLFAGNDEEQTYLGYLPVLARSGSSIKYPFVYKTFVENNFRLLKPTAKYLENNKAQTISLFAPGWKKALIRIKEQNIFMEKTGEHIFSKSFAKLEADKLTIFGTKTDGNRFEAAITVFGKAAK